MILAEYFDNSSKLDYAESYYFENLEKRYEEYMLTKVINSDTIKTLGIIEAVKLVHQEISPNRYPRIQALIDRYDTCKEDRKNV